MIRMYGQRSCNLNDPIVLINAHISELAIATILMVFFTFYTLKSDTQIIMSKVSINNAAQV